MHFLRGIGALVVASWTISLSPNEAQASHVSAGAPEHLIAQGGECIRLFHSKGDIGCRTLSNAEMAALYPIETQTELDTWLKQTSSTDKVALVIPEELVTMDLLDTAKARIASIYAISSGKNISFASQTPQGEGSIDGILNPFASAKIKWNPDGYGLHGRSFPHPIVLLNPDDNVGPLFLARAKQNRKSQSGATYTAFMKYYYGPETMTTPQCLGFTNIYGEHSPKCDPIGGQSAWSLRGNRSNSETVMVMTGMDAYALSQVLSPGANQAVSGVVAVLAAAKALQTIPDTAFNKQIVFALFQAEKFGMVGSRRFLSDIRQAAKQPCLQPVQGSSSPFAADFCTSPMATSTTFTKLNLSSISYAIAVDQVGILDPKNKQLWVHVNPNVATSNATTTLLQSMTKAPSAKAQVVQSTVKTAIPPTPLLSFLNDKEYGKNNLVSAVLTGYDSTYNNNDGTYASRHDVVEKLDVAAIVQAAQVLAESIYTLSVKTFSNESIATIQVDKELVQTLVHCLTNDWHCEVMEQYMKPFVSTLNEYLGIPTTSYPTYQSPVTLYAGAMNRDRQSLVISEFNTNKATSKTDYREQWSDVTNRMSLYPNAYEMFLRSFLASSMIDANSEKGKACKTSQDCMDQGTKRECVFPGFCAEQRAFFHDAYSPGLSRTAIVGQYDVVNTELPLWSEPKWDNDVGSYVFPNPGQVIGWVALGIGMVVSVMGYVVAKWILNSVHKLKLL